jgi:uncharacterized membrane protein YqjE
MGEIGQAGQGIFASLRTLVRTLIRIGHNRLELLLVEWQEERWRLFEALLLVGLALIFALMSLLVVTMTVVVLCIQAHRYECIAGLFALFLAATGISVWQLRKRLKNWVPFAATLEEIKKDKECLREKN